MDELGRILPVDKRRRCYINDPDEQRLTPGYFHMWFTLLDGWPKALVELDDGKMIAVGYQKIIFESSSVSYDPY